jgi:hypothetical protein
MKEQYITDIKGRKMSVILPIRKYTELLEKLEELEDLKAYDEAVASNEEAVPIHQAFKKIETKRNDL